MALDIETFTAAAGGSSLFKALGHPLAAPRVAAIAERLAASRRVAVYDPNGQIRTVAALCDLARVPVAALLVQDAEHVGREALGAVARPVTDLPALDAEVLFVAAFDAERLVGQIRHLIPAGTTVVTLDEARLPDAMLSDRRTYLAGVNWATNFAFFRDADGLHTRIVTANYWSAYGAAAPRMWCRLFDGSGRAIATWEDTLPPANATVTLDSADVRRRFDLPAFTGQLFVHVLGAAGHDVVKYALDTYGDADTVLSCTHDANAWPSDLYAGLPAPDAGETVVFWVQNSHPVPIPVGGVTLNRMGVDRPVALPRPVPAFATERVDVSALLPDLRWPDQIEIRAGRHLVRPRYEIAKANGRLRIAHPNVERSDLRSDPKLAAMGHLFGKGFILPAPVFPTGRYRTFVQPTPMSTAQTRLPIQLGVFDQGGRALARHRFGDLPRDHDAAIEIGDLLARSGATLEGAGHLEITYDFEAGDTADGWLHAIFRYEDLETGHAAETSFGSHIFNTVLTYKGEPQSYAGRPPGLSTRLFLRLGPDPVDTLCHLVYPASTPWHATSDTAFVLTDRTGREVATRRFRIPCGGSLHYRHHAHFNTKDRAEAGPDAYVLIRDTTCRLFGYHGLVREGASFSLDHMFGF
ncbi:MAG: hypothetical protein ACK5YI_01890 [Rhodospirillales bacterium]|jgi:hypothetical protein